MCVGQSPVNPRLWQILEPASGELLADIEDNTSGNGKEVLHLRSRGLARLILLEPTIEAAE